MFTVSLCMIVKNEEETLARCLNSVRSVVDEIVIVDTGSSDRTKEIAAEFTDKIYDFEWIDDFSAARNFSFEQATMDYILWLDADDILLPEDVLRFKKLKKNLPTEIDAVMMKYNTGFDAAGRVTFSYFRERLAKRSKSFKWKEPVHEYLETIGHRINSDVCVTHSKPHERVSSRNIEIYENLIEKGEKLTPRGMYYYARELKDNGRFADAINQFRQFLDSGLGWVEDNITACSDAAKCCLMEKKDDEALAFMLKSFSYDNPRAEICCQIGYYFKNKGRYDLAAFWFKLALKLRPDQAGWGFRQKECSDYIPCIELAVCYDKLGAYRKASKYNDKAAKYKPDSDAVLYNKKYFKEKLAGRS